MSEFLFHALRVRAIHPINLGGLEAHMKDYYDVLDIPVTATPEQIKLQYRQLVRIYHPDRFMDKNDKVYAEEKLKEINIAFQVLSGAFVRGEAPESVPAPRPVAYPPTLDFGTLKMGEKGVRSVQIGNLGSDAKHVNFVYSVEQPWFKVSKGKRVYADRPFPLDFQITVDTRRLEAQHNYQEWITVELDGVPVRVPLALTVAARPRQLRLAAPWFWGSVFAMLLLGLLLAAPIFGFDQLAIDLIRPVLSGQSAYVLHPNEMLFSVRENDVSTLYAGVNDRVTPRRLGVVGKQAVGAQESQQIAYLSGPAGHEQIYLFSLVDGKTRQLTQSPEAKTALAWSPDGTHLGYLLGAETAARIGIYNVQSNQEHYLPGEVTAGVGSFAWSPDSQSLLFALAERDAQYVYRIDINGDNLQQLTDFDSRAGAWSPDGTQVVVAATKGLYLLNHNGQPVRQLNDAAAETVKWSADGTWLAYTTSTPNEEAAQGGALWLTDRTGKQTQQLVENSLWHLWSPDGATLGYITGAMSDEEPLLYLWTVTPGAAPQLVAEVSDPFFAWPS